MNSTKEAQLNAAVLGYAATCLAEGELHLLTAMGWQRNDVEALQDMHLDDLQRLARLSGHFLKVTIDRDCFARILAHIRREREAEDAKRHLLENDAPMALMGALYGMTGAEYAGRRKLLGLTSGAGRVPEPNEDQDHAVWAAFKSLGKADADNLTGNDWLTLMDRTGVPMRIIWYVVQHYGAQDDGPDKTLEVDADDANVVPLRR